MRFFGLLPLGTLRIRPRAKRLLNRQFQRVPDLLLLSLALFITLQRFGGWC